jgi:hypothetical protein
MGISNTRRRPCPSLHCSKWELGASSRIFSRTNTNKIKKKKFPYSHFNLQIHDGFDEESKILLVEDQKILEKSRKDLPAAVYTTKSAASVRFKKLPTSNFQLRIQKVKHYHLKISLLFI